MIIMKKRKFRILSKSLPTHDVYFAQQKTGWFTWGMIPHEDFYKKDEEESARHGEDIFVPVFYASEIPLSMALKKYVKEFNKPKPNPFPNFVSKIKVIDTFEL